MKRNPSNLAGGQFDIAIVGGGVYGICAAWDAASRGLSVALIERGDFCGETSANPLKIVHGGFRYMQAANLGRVRASSRERNTLMRIAPHQVDPLPFFIPTYGHGMKGKEIIAAGLAAYNTVVFDRNRGQRDADKQIPWGELFSKEETLKKFPGIDSAGLTGGVAFYDAQMHSPPRLAFCILKSAVDAGAEVANYVEATGFLREGDSVTGVKARDTLTGDEFEINANVVINTTGPWSPRVLEHLGIRLQQPLEVTKDLYLVVDRSLDDKYAVAIPSRHKEPTAKISRGVRHFFVIPWRGKSLIGSSHVLYEGHPDEFELTQRDIQDLIDEVNIAMPSMQLTMDDVSTWNSGMVSFGHYYGEHSRIIDHARDDGLQGMLSVIGVRYTTARGVGEKAVDLAARKMGRQVPKSRTGETPIYGGAFTGFADLVDRVAREGSGALDHASAVSIARHFGSEYRDVLGYIEDDASNSKTIGDSGTIRAQALHAVRQEMAVRLDDVVMRRTDLGTAGFPGDEALRECADVMAMELGWSQLQIDEEIERMKGVAPWRVPVYS